MKKTTPRADRYGEHRAAFARNSKIILATREVCGICGRPVDKARKYPDPLAPSVDHIVPIARGGHPSDIENLQLAHWICNERKGDKLMREKRSDDPKMQAEIGNRNLPLSRDWAGFAAGEE